MIPIPLTSSYVVTLTPVFVPYPLDGEWTDGNGGVALDEDSWLIGLSANAVVNVASATATGQEMHFRVYVDEGTGGTPVLEVSFDAETAASYSGTDFPAPASWISLPAGSYITTYIEYDGGVAAGLVTSDHNAQVWAVGRGR